MKLPDKVNPAHCVYKDQTRYVLTYVRIQDGLAIATDGRSAIFAQVEVQEDDTITEGVVPTAALKQAMKNKLQKGEFKFVPKANDPDGEHGVDVQVPVNVEACTTYYGPEKLDYPVAVKVIPDHEKPLSVSLNVKLLKQLADGLGQDMVTVTVDVENPDRCYIVTSAKQHHAFALLMPCRDGVEGVEWEPAQNATLDMARALRDAALKPKEA